MRLIDADKLICSLSDYALQEAPNDNMDEEEREFQQQIYETISCCIDAIIEQPAAYDVDKVAKQICKECLHIKECSRHYDCALIRIVKSSSECEQGIDTDFEEDHFYFE